MGRVRGVPEAHDVLMQGFPPPRDHRVTLDNWQEPPYNRWAFRHVREVIPTHRIPHGEHVRPLAYALQGIDDVLVPRVDGGLGTFRDVVDVTYMNALLVLHDGRVVHEEYAPGMRPDQPHLLMSISKSIVGCVTGILAGHGLLSPQDRVVDHVPEVAGSGYDKATVRHLLDMRTGVRFREEYTDPDAEVRVMERSMGWRPREDDTPSGMYSYLTTLEREHAHGGRFVYRSADTDMLGWVVERAAGVRMSDLVSSLLWVPLGCQDDAEQTCDALGSGIHDGGICATARDVARFGQMLLDDGAVDGHPVIPAEWLAQTRALDADVRQAFARSDSEPYLPGGWYRNQFWFVPGVSGDVMLCLGIHGQMVFVDRATRTVGVKFSTWPEAQHPAALIDTIRAFSAVGRELAGLPPLEHVDRTRTGAPVSVVTSRH
jgi:CubicO group peptidase (beta-lactamase class C family)